MKMKKKMILLVSLLLLTAAVLGGMPQDAWADTQSKEYVVDDAGLFTDKELKCAGKHLMPARRMS